MNAADPPVRPQLDGLQVLGEFHGGVARGRLRASKGGDPTPPFEGLPDELCQCPPQGPLLSGRAQVRLDGGRLEAVEAGQDLSWPPGYAVWTGNGVESMQINPAAAMRYTLDRIGAELPTSGAGHR